MTVKAELCPCGHPTCKTYSVSNGNFYQGCGWNKQDAEFVAWCFNNRTRINELFATSDKDNADQEESQSS